MTKAYDSFVSNNPTLFKVATLDLFVKVGFLSQDIYEVAKQAIEEYQTELSTKNKEVEQPVRQQSSDGLNSSVSELNVEGSNQDSLVALSEEQQSNSAAAQSSENTELSSEESSTKQTTTIV